jgi:hypothetical protein
MMLILILILTHKEGWYVYGCTEWSMCVGRHKYSDTYQFGAGEYQWDCDGEVTSKVGKKR